MTRISGAIIWRIIGIMSSISPRCPIPARARCPRRACVVSCATKGAAIQHRLIVMSPSAFIPIPRFKTAYTLKFTVLLYPVRQTSFPPHAQGIGHTIDIVEPGRNESDLKNAAIVEPHTPQLFMVRRPDSRRIARELSHVVQHHALLL